MLVEGALQQGPQTTARGPHPARDPFHPAREDILSIMKK